MNLFPPSSGLPGSFPVGFGAYSLVWGLMILVAVGGMGLLLWQLRTRRIASYSLRCPTHGTRATVTIQMPSKKQRAQVAECSLCHPPTRVDCDQRCVKLVA